MVGWLANHRGPFLLNVVRPGKKAGFNSSEWLKGSVEKADVEEEVHALLTDPRDSITAVSVWSELEEQFAGTFTLRDIDTLLNQ